MAVAIIKGSAFKHSLSESELSGAIARIEKAAAVSRALRKQIAFEVQHHVPGLPAVDAFLSSPDTMLACAVEAAKKRPGRHRPTLEKLLNVPSLLDLKKPLPEIDWVRVKEKTNGDYRFIHNFGLLHRTAKQMVLRVMEPRFTPRPFQHTFKGFPDLICRVKAELSGGNVYAATLDIKDHFGSFSTKKLANELPVPMEWVDYVVVDDM